MRSSAQHTIKNIFLFFLLSFILMSNRSFTEESSSWMDITPLGLVVMKDLSDWNQRCYGFYNAQASLMGSKTEEREKLMQYFSQKSVVFIETAIRLDATITGQSIEDQTLATFTSGNKYLEIYSDALYHGITASDKNVKKLHEARTSFEMQTCDNVELLSDGIK